MEEATTVTDNMYNPHALIALRRIEKETSENKYVLYKATELETVLNHNNLLEQRLASQEKQLGQIIDNLTRDGWYNPNTEKEDVLRDLCEILGHSPVATLNFTATISVSGSVEVPLDEVEDFDIRYFVGDNLSVDSNDFTMDVNSWDVDDIDSQDWE